MILGARKSLIHSYRFRWAALQLGRLLKQNLLLEPDVAEILLTLPQSLNETYDTILENLSTKSLRNLAMAVLRWLTLAHQPLLIEELIEVCAICLEQVDLPLEKRRIRRASHILQLLPNLVALEPHPDHQLTSQLERGKYYVLLSHFSVKEYLLQTAIDFKIDPKLSHQSIARDCVSYLYRTNTIEKRSHDYPLRSYAWDLWALHAVASEAVTGRDIEQRAHELFEIVSKRPVSTEWSHRHQRSDVLLPTDRLPHALLSLLEGVAEWHTRKVLIPLQNPYFFEEYTENEVDTPLNPERREIRLLQLHPSQHWFTEIRCSLEIVSLDSNPQYEVISHCWGNATNISYIRLSGNGIYVTTQNLKHLRSLRGNSESRVLWVDFICVHQIDMDENSELAALISSIYSKSVQAAAMVSDEPDDQDIWALDIIDNIVSLLRHGVKDDLNTLQTILKSRQSYNPFCALDGLFNQNKQRYWSRLWTMQDIMLAPRTTF